MFRSQHCAAILIVCALLVAAVPVVPAVAAPPGGARAMMGMRGGMMVAPMSPMMMNMTSLSPGTGANLAGIRALSLYQSGFPFLSPTMQGGFGYGAGAYGGGYGGAYGGGYGGGYGGSYGGGYGGGYGSGSGGAGYGSTAASMMRTIPAETSQAVPSPAAGPFVGLLNAEGGLDWPLVLRILPPGPQTRDLRQQIDARAGEVQRQIAVGRVDPMLLRDANRDLDTLGAILAERGDRLEVPQQAITDARKFLRKLHEVLQSAP